MKYTSSDRPLMHLFKHIGKLLDDRLRRDLREKGIHFGQSRILLALMRHGSLNQSAIGSGLDIKPATVTTMIKKMEAAQLIERHRDANDDRVINVTLTAKGHEAAEFTTVVIDKIEDEIREGLSPNEIEILVSPLEKVREILGGFQPSL